MDQGSSIAKNGETRKVTVLFCDIRGFTQYSEKHTPDEVAELVNQYFSVIIEIIKSNHGKLEKFLGDGFMATWGSSGSVANQNLNAINACLEIRGAISILNTLRVQDGLEPMLFGMGVHCGIAYCGEVGWGSYKESTVLGDAVNVASRIESLTKVIGVDVLLSSSVVAPLRRKFMLEHAGTEEIKGHSQKIRVYKVNGTVTETGDPFPIKTPYSSWTSHELARKQYHIETPTAG